jgi:hypothetical protein
MSGNRVVPKSRAWRWPSQSTTTTMPRPIAIALDQMGLSEEASEDGDPAAG